MRTKFSFPARATRVRRFSKLPRLPASAWVVLDGGIPGWALEGPRILRVPGGEISKSWAELERILAWLAGAGAERSATLIAIGGGATLDLAALAASLYRRGMPLILVPTTLLGMVDATLGGKTAVDFSRDGRFLKNFAGTFYPAGEVWLLPSFLSTLPARERVSGAGEVFKTMWIRGRAWDSRALGEFVRTGTMGRGLVALIEECLRVKARLVERDPLDGKRVRELLNFGHTIGHALESAAGGRLSHGECVLWGMAVESSLLGRGGAKQANECAVALRELGLALPTELSSVPAEEWVRLLGGDKKNKGGRIEMSLLACPGRPVKRRFAPERVAQAILDFR